MIGIYIHIPFCSQKCNYCDFASYPSMLERSNEYIDALCKEIKSYTCEKVDTLYFGGGTPSILSTQQLLKISDVLFSKFDVSDTAEITVEVNPGTVNKEKLRDIRSAGFNRISLGSQSFSDAELRTLGRIHTSSDTVNCFMMARDAGFDNISLDLMYAVPGQSMESLSTSVSQVLKLSPEHISCYGLKFEPGTPFYNMLERGELFEKSDDEYADMYDFIRSSLSDAGYIQYELSNFATPGFESQHNVKYWQTHDYIGVGLGAASCYKGNRYSNTPDFDEYINKCAKAEFVELTYEDRMSEYMILSLRLTQKGASKTEFESRFKCSMSDVFAEPLKKHISTGMLIDCGDRIILSPDAYYVSNSVLCDFV